MRKKNVVLGLVAGIILLACVAPFAYILLQACRAENRAWTAEYYYQVFLASPKYLLRFLRAFCWLPVLRRDRQCFLYWPGSDLPNTAFHARISCSFC